MTAYAGFIILMVLGVIGAALLFIFFPTILALSIGTTPSSRAPSPISEVSIPQYASAEDTQNFDPETVSVMIGLNNKVRWTNYDFAKISVLADDKSDPGFFNSTHNNGASDDPTRESILNSYETFEYTFTKAGEYGYHCSFHTWMRGTVKVMPPSDL